MHLMMGTQAPLLIDVACGDNTLPAAKCIFGAGLAYSDAKADAAREKIFFDLLHALAPDPTRPVVFFSTNANSWLSANAAFRAAKAARNVVWYRGGLAAWRSAQLPTVTTAPVGAVTE
jgi:rhodanese-related sulfurtransferase